MSDDNVKKDPQQPDSGDSAAKHERKSDENQAPETPVEKAAGVLAKESGENPPAKVPENYDVSVPVNEKEVAEFTPEPDKDGVVNTNAVGDKVKVEEGKATPTDETVKVTLEKQQPGGETAEALAAEQRRDAEATAEGRKEHAETSAADMQGETAPVPAAEAPAAAPRRVETPEEKEARRAAARAARDAAKAAAKAGGEATPTGDSPAAAGAAKAEATEEAAPKEPSPKQPQLDRAVAIITEAVHSEAVEAAVINEKNGDMPTLTIRSEHWLNTAETLKNHADLSMNYLRNVSGVDQESHLEVVYHFINLNTKNELCVRIKTDRDNASVPSVTPLYQTANWPEREVYDLLGIDFPGHPDLRRIMMPDDWEGYPLRKDYEPIDPEV